MTTAELAERVVQQSLDSIDDRAIMEAKRSLLNWMGVAIGAASHPMIDMILDTGNALSGRPQATVLGRVLKVDAMTACLANGVSSHIFDYDDTLLDTVLHPSAPIFPALLSYAEQNPVHPRRLLAAFVLGVEVAQRVAQVVYPSHYDRGWHITGSVGAFGAATAVGKLMGLGVQQMIYAFGLCATQPVGLREMFGTFTKPFHPGKAAANGYEAAMLAAKGFTSSTKSIEARRGFAHVTSDAPKFPRLTENWGNTWEIPSNSYKPFPCGVVIHPTIDAVAQLQEKHTIEPASIATVELSVHPLVLELTGKKEPRDGLEAKFSVYHCAAAGLIDGWVGLAQFADSRVNSPDVIDLRSKVTATVDDSMHEDQVRVVVTTQSGKTYEIFVEHCLGSKENPMSKEQIERKFRDVTTPVLSPERQNWLIEQVWSFDTAGSLTQLLEGTKPVGE